MPQWIKQLARHRSAGISYRNVKQTLAQITHAARLLATVALCALVTQLCGHHYKAAAGTRDTTTVPPRSMHGPDRLTARKQLIVNSQLKLVLNKIRWPARPSTHIGNIGASFTPTFDAACCSKHFNIRSRSVRDRSTPLIGLLCRTAFSRFRLQHTIALSRQAS